MWKCSGQYCTKTKFNYTVLGTNVKGKNTSGQCLTRHLTLCLHLHGPFNSLHCMVNLMNMLQSLSLSDSKQQTFAFLFCSCWILPKKRFYAISWDEINFCNNMIHIFSQIWAIMYFEHFVIFKDLVKKCWILKPGRLSIINHNLPFLLFSCCYFLFLFS